ncbi:hypothetical protein FRC04_010567 [Tulasnella sp. 424]|nr:hypothetical protein FRC04_010567 [Tulasnella sp. 424]
MGKSLDTYEIDRKLQKRLNREVKIWTALRHRNIAPLLGFNLSGEVCLISSWFTNGNIAAHLEANPDADRLELIRQIAAGVAYLHGRNPIVVHGDLKPTADPQLLQDNVLIDDNGIAKLIDFGLSKAVEIEQGATALSSTSLRDVGNLSETVNRSDVGEIFTGDVPFKSNSDRTLYHARFNGEQPMVNEADYPALKNTNLVGVLRSCWKIDPVQRPMMSVVAQRLDPPHHRLESTEEPDLPEPPLPTRPFMNPTSPNFSPKLPHYNPTSPRYSTTSLHYSTTSPHFTPASPDCSPTPTNCSPTSPLYTPASPRYTPESPLWL